MEEWMRAAIEAVRGRTARVHPRDMDPCDMCVAEVLGRESSTHQAMMWAYGNAGVVGGRAFDVALSLILGEGGTAAVEGKAQNPILPHTPTNGETR